VRACRSTVKATNDCVSRQVLQKRKKKEAPSPLKGGEAGTGPALDAQERDLEKKGRSDYGARFHLEKLRPDAGGKGKGRCKRLAKRCFVTHPMGGGKEGCNIIIGGAFNGREGRRSHSPNRGAIPKKKARRRKERPRIGRKRRGAGVL